MNILPWKEVAVSSVRSVLMNAKIQLEDVIKSLNFPVFWWQMQGLVQLTVLY